MHHSFRLFAVVATLGAAGSFFSQPVHAQSVWGQAASGTFSWNAATNWAVGGVPNATGAGADFSQVSMAGNQTVTVASDTVGSLIFGGLGTAPALLTLSGSTLTLYATAGTPTITVNSLPGGGPVTISSALHATNGFIMNGNGGTLSLSGTWAYVSNTVAIKEGTLYLNAVDSTIANGVTNVVLGDPAGGSASLLFSNANMTFPTPIQLATNAAGTLTIGQTGSHCGFAGAVALNGNTLTVENLSSGSSAGMLVQGGINGVGNVIFNSSGTNNNSYIEVETVPVNNSGTITMAGTSTKSNGIEIAATAGVGTNVTAVNFNSSYSPMAINGTTVGAAGLALNLNSPLSPTTAGWGGTGTLTLNCNNSGSFSLGTLAGFAGNILNAGTGTGTVTMGVFTNSTSSVTQDSPTSELILTATGNTYSGGTSITAGTVALTGGALNGLGKTGGLTIAAGGTLDVSGLTSSNYTLSTTSLVVNGTATINGKAGGNVSLGAVPLTLNFDGADPALYVPQGTLVLTTNAVAVDTSLPLGIGSYDLMQASNAIVGTGPFPAVSGTAIGFGNTGNLQIGGTNVYLLVNSAATAPAITSLSPVSGTTNGGTTITLNGANFANGATVQFGTNAPVPAMFVSSTELLVTTPPHASGTVTVAIANPNAQNTFTNFTFTVPPAQPTLVSVVNTAGILSLVWQGGAGQNCILLSSSNLTLPLSQWTPVVTNAVSANGLSSNSIAMDFTQPAQFFLLALPGN